MVEHDKVKLQPKKKNFDHEVSHDLTLARRR